MCYLQTPLIQLTIVVPAGIYNVTAQITETGSMSQLLSIASFIIDYWKCLIIVYSGLDDHVILLWLKENRRELPLKVKQDYKLLD